MILVLSSTIKNDLVDVCGGKVAEIDFPTLIQQFHRQIEREGNTFPVIDKLVMIQVLAC